MKLSKEELIKKVSEKVTDEDVAIELMEDITDSFDDSAAEVYKARYEAEKAEMEEQIANEKAYIMELKQRYKERFLAGSADIEDNIDVEDNKPEETVIDVKEI